MVRLGSPAYPTGTEIAKIRHSSQRKTLADGVVVDHLFSAKPKPADVYSDYYVKVSTYVSIISGAAWRMNGATAQTYPFIPEEEDSEGPFRYIDTAPSRAEGQKRGGVARRYLMKGRFV